jgi:hypothetical protein
MAGSAKARNATTGKTAKGPMVFFMDSSGELLESRTAVAAKDEAIAARVACRQGFGEEQSAARP